MTSRKIIHIDMDAFFASVEQRDNPELKGKPVVVGGSPKSRGVVCTCSYEARKYGIHSAMPSARAFQLCPHAVFVKTRMAAYKEASQAIRSVFYSYTDLVEPLSLDEAYLDVTSNKKGMTSATWIARDILAEIYKQTSLTASAGVSYNKFIAKLASDFQKPNGLTVIPPGDEVAFLESLPIRKFFGIGKVTEQKMIKNGIETGADLKSRSKLELVRLFANSGEYYYQIVRGVDDRAVVPDRVRKSIGRETTLREDVDDVVYLKTVLDSCAEEVEEIAKKQNKRGKTVVLKVKYHDFKTVTRSVTLDHFCNDLETIICCAHDLLEKTDVGSKAVRLIGVTLTNFEDLEPSGPVQLTFEF